MSTLVSGKYDLNQSSVTLTCTMICLFKIGDRSKNPDHVKPTFNCHYILNPDSMLSSYPLTVALCSPPPPLPCWHQSSEDPFSFSSSPHTHHLLPEPLSLPSCRTCQDQSRVGPESTLKSILTSPESTGTMSLMLLSGGQYVVEMSNLQLLELH